DGLDRTAHADLFSLRLPMEAQRDVRIGGEFPAFGAFGVGVENEAAMGGFLQQHHADVGVTFSVRRGNGHGVGFVGFGLFGLFHPGVEQRQGIVPFGDAPVVHGAAYIAHGASFASLFCVRKAV